MAAEEVRLEVQTPAPFRLPRAGGMDGLLRVRGGVLHRLLHRDGRPVLVRAVQTGPRRVLFGAQADEPENARWGIARMRVATGVDLDITPFIERFRWDPLIGPSVRRDPGLRVRARPTPFEALMCAVTEQLIEFERAVEIQRRINAALGRRCPRTGLRDSPEAARVATQAPAWLESKGLTGGRAIALRRVAAEIAAGRVDLEDPDHETGWARLRRIRGIGSWTVECLALLGQSRMDQLPAGDLAYVKFVGRALSGDPYGRASEDEVREFFAPYGEWAGLAGLHALRCSGAARPRRRTPIGVG